MNNQSPPEKTGYKVIDAVLYCFSYLFTTSRKDIRAFSLVAFVLIAITGWGLFVREVLSTPKQIDAARKEERELCKVEIALLRHDIDTLKKQFILLENEYRQSEKEANDAITRLYERMVKNKEEQK